MSYMTKWYLVCFHVDKLRLHWCTILILFKSVKNLNLSLVFNYMMSWYLRCPFTFSRASFNPKKCLLKNESSLSAYASVHFMGNRLLLLHLQTYVYVCLSICLLAIQRWFCARACLRLKREKEGIQIWYLVGVFVIPHYPFLMGNF